MNQRYKKIPEKKRRGHEEDLRVENQRLRKEIKQLRKQLHRMNYREEEIQEFIEEFEIVAKEQETQDYAKRCPKCNSNKISILEKIRGNIDYYICDSCGGRGQLK